MKPERFTDTFGITSGENAGKSVTELRQIIDYRAGIASDTNQFSAFFGDCTVNDLPDDVQQEVRAVAGNINGSQKVSRLGMTASELEKKADAHNLESAQKNLRKDKMTARRAAEEVHGNISKHILINNDKIVDGHHHLAKAIKGKVTKSLPVIDLSPLRFQLA